MKRALPVLLIFLSGCIVQSFYPFYTNKSKVALPEANGEWDAVITFGEKVDTTNVPPWQISDNLIIAYNKESQPAKIDVTFFKLGSQLFCDSTAGNIGDDIPWYWAWHARPVHTVTKVETNANSLMFIPLDLEWLTNRVATSRISLPLMTGPGEDWPLFTAKSSDWEKFLAKYANNADAFPTNHIYILKRHMTVPTK